MASSSDKTNNSNINDIDAEIEELTISLNELNIQRARLERECKKKQISIVNLVRKRNRLSEDFEAIGNRKKDRNGTIIDVGDNVTFLTKGRFNSKGGIVTKIDHIRFITAQDKQGRKINREPQNVRIVKKAYQNDDAQYRC